MSSDEYHPIPSQPALISDVEQTGPILSDVKPKSERNYYFTFGIIGVISVIMITVSIFLFSYSGKPVSNDPTNHNTKTIIENKIPETTEINQNVTKFTPIYRGAGKVSDNFKPQVFRPHELGKELAPKVFATMKPLTKKDKQVLKTKREVKKMVQDEEDMRITASGIRSPHPKDDWDPPAPIPEEKDFLDHLKYENGESIPGLVSNENQKQDIFSDIIVKDVIDNPYPYVIDEGITETKRANPGCAVIYEDVIHKGHTRFVRVCLTGDTKIQTIMIPTEQLSIPHDYVAVVAGKNTFVSFFDGSTPVVSMGPYQFFHTNDHKYYNHIHITFLQDTVIDNIDRVMVEVTGKIFTPPPCITLSNGDPSQDKNTVSFMICGKPGRDMYHASRKKLQRSNVQLAMNDKIQGIDVSFIEVGLMAEMQVFGNEDYNEEAHSLRLGNNTLTDLTNVFLEGPGEETRTPWAQNVQAIICNYK